VQLSVDADDSVSGWIWYPRERRQGSPGDYECAHNAVYVRRRLADCETRSASKTHGYRLSDAQLDQLAGALQNGPAAHGYIEVRFLDNPELAHPPLRARLVGNEGI
jgi:hypothetical protein